MDKLRLSISVALLFLVALGCPQGTNARSVGTLAHVDWLEARLREAMDKRSASDGLPRGTFDVLFLFDSSQAGWKSAYRAHVQSVIEEFLRRRASEPGGSQRSVAIHAYQAQLYAEPGQGLPFSAINDETIGRVADALPNDRLTTDPKGRGLSTKGGHDHSGARREAILHLRESRSKASKPLLIVQLTTVPFNELPGSDRDRVERSRDARTALLDGTGVEPYDVPGLPLYTESAGPGQDPFPVYCWIYGPPDLSQMNLVNVQQKAPKSQEPPPDTRKPLPWLRLFGGLILLGAVAAAIAIALRPVPIRILAGNSELYGAHVRRGNRVSICGPGTKAPGPHALVLTDSVAPGAPADRLAHIVVPWFAAPYLEGGLFTIHSAHVKANRVILTSTRTFSLRSKTDGSQTSGLSVKIG